MGIWEFLTKPIKLTSAIFYWQEPTCYRLRLRGDLLIRCGFVLAVWASAIGIFSLLFVFNQNPPGLSLSIIMGGILGLGPAFLAMFFRRDHVSGSLWIYHDHLLHQRSYISLGLFRSWQEIQEWPNESITGCLIIPDRVLGKSFSVMLLKINSTVEMIGIPNKIKLKELARHFTEAGIPVEKRDSLPDRYAEGFKPLITVAMAIVGVVLLSVGLGFYFERVPGPGNQIAVREQAPDFPQDIPQFPNPAQAIPNPLAPAPISRNNQPTEKENISAPPTGTPNFAPPNLRSEGPGPFKDRFPDRMLSRPGRPPAQPGPPTPEPENSIPTPNGKGVGNANDSKLIGNSEGGVPFRMVNGEGKTLRGFQYSMGSWAGEPALRNLIPLYERRSNHLPAHQT